MNITKNVKHWAYAFFSDFISGGANAVTGSISASLLDPEKFNLTNQLAHFLELAAVIFFVNGFMGAMAYLKANPLPPEDS